VARRSIAVAIAALLVCVPSTAGQSQRGVAVAGPTPSGGQLFVYDQRNDLCLAIRRPGQRPPGSICGDEVPRLRTPTLNFQRFGRDRPAFVWGVVAPEVSAIEPVFPDGRRVRIETSEGAAYRGRLAGRVRFFVAETHAEPLYVRLLDQAGQLLAAEEMNPDSYDPAATSLPIARGRIVGERWRLSAFRRPRLRPLPGEEERIVQESCVDLQHSSGPLFSGPFPEMRICADPDGAFGPWNLEVDTACRGVGLTAVGLAPPTARRLVAVLGDGRRVRVPLRELPARFGDERPFVLVLGPRTALRRMVAFEAGGRRTLVRGIAPGIANCPHTGSTFITSLDLTRAPRIGPGGPALQVRDEGVLLCATIGLPRAVDCWHPPLDEGDSRILWHPTDAGTYAAGVLPQQVASVVLEWDDGERLRLETTTEGPYEGRYQGLVRFFTVSLPGRRILRRVELLDASGQQLLGTSIHEPPVYDPGPVVVLRGSGGWRLGAGVLRAPRSGRRALCLELSRGALDPEPVGCLGTGPNVEVSCRPRGMRLYGRLPKGARTARVETDLGVFEARTARLPSRLGVRGRLYLVELPAGARPRRVVLEGRRTKRHPVRLPAARAQCGYGTGIG
jgi:hypothetical protein